MFRKTPDNHCSAVVVAVAVAVAVVDTVTEASRGINVNLVNGSLKNIASDLLELPGQAARSAR